MKIVQICTAVYTGDGVGKDILTKAELLEELGYTCEIYAEDIDPQLKKRVKPLSDLSVSEEDILMHHYAGYTDLVSIVKQLRCTKVLVYHNITPPELVAPDMRSACELSYQQLPQLNMVYDYYLADSEYNLKDLKKYGVTQEGDVLPIEVSFEDKSHLHTSFYEKRDAAVRILYVGRIVKNKRQEDLIRIFDHYYNHYNNNADLYLVGSWDASPDYYRDLTKLVKSLQSNPRIHFLGKVSDEELNRQYSQADIYISMSQHEGFGIPLLESMQYEIPVFAYDAAAVSDTLGGAGILLKTNDPAEVAAIIDELLQDKTAYEAVIQKQNDRLEDFSHQNIKKKFAELIKKWNHVSFENEEESLLYQQFMQKAKEAQMIEQKKALNEDLRKQNQSAPQNPLEHYIWQMDSTKENYAYRNIYSCRKVIGGAIVLFKRVVRKLLKWYIEPICFQQTNFNNASTDAIKILAGKINAQEGAQETLFKEIEEKIENNKYEVKALEEKIQDSLAKADEIKNGFAQRNTDLELQLQYMVSRMESMERYIKKIDALNLGVFEDDPLLYWERDKTSQSGEDAIIAMATGTLGIPLKDITYLDIGANHAKYLSNTYFFYRNGARGVLVEANPELIPELKFYRHEDVILNRCVSEKSNDVCSFYVMNGDGLSTASQESVQEIISENPAIQVKNIVDVPAITMNELMDQFFPASPVLLNIDVEGMELKILQSMDFEKYRPLFMIIEMIPYRANKVVIGEKNQEIVEFMKNKGYVEYAFTGINSVFVDKGKVEAMQNGGNKA